MKYPALNRAFIKKLEKFGITASKNKNNKLNWAFPVYFNHQNLMKQGFKLHVSATVLTANGVLERIAPTLLKRRQLFKVTGNLNELARLNDGFYGFSQIGKFMTIYPSSTEDALSLSRELSKITKEIGLAGPKIPSDNPVEKNAIVFYRYGTFKNDKYMETPTGEKIPDSRHPKKVVPDWMDDPFQHGTCSQKRKAGLFAGRFVITQVLRQRAKGGVYRCMELHPKTPPRGVILKEARHAGGVEPDGVDAVKRLQWQYKVLKELKNSGIFPKPYRLFKFHQNHYLSMEEINGKSLKDIILKNNEITLRQSILWIRQIGEAVNLLHKQGLYFYDLSPDNVMVCANNKIYLVDLEYAYRHDAPGLALPSAGTPGFYPKSKKMGTTDLPARDIFALGNLLYVLLMPEWYKGFVQERNPEAAWMKPKLPDSLPKELKKLYKRSTTSQESGFSVNDFLRSIAHTEQELYGENKII